MAGEGWKLMHFVTVLTACYAEPRDSGRFRVDPPEAHTFDTPRDGEAHSQVRAGMEQKEVARHIQTVSEIRRQKLPRSKESDA